MNLPANSTERLLAIADLIETKPELYEQQDWAGPEVAYAQPIDSANQPECGTACCVGGWAVRLSPRELISDVQWSKVARELLELPYGFAGELFYSFNITAPDMAAILRDLAAIPPEYRNYENHFTAVVRHRIRMLENGVAGDES